MLKSLSSKLMVVGFGVLLTAYAVSFFQGWFKLEVIYVIIIGGVIGAVAFLMIRKNEKEYSMTEALASGQVFIEKARSSTLNTDTKVNWMHLKGFRGKAWVMQLVDGGDTVRIDVDAKTNQPVGLAFDVDSEAAPFVRKQDVDYSEPTLTPDMTDKVVDAMVKRRMEQGTNP